ncbi:MAG: YebC/PmpR family DNA-binding transcriptional regulator [Acidobacteria bacterium]|nr:YebC/PmpR family DNA-binding transcriptional regulator [Acidobacteriota bacterium]
MSGHSKWHSIKHKKAAVDAKRGREFTRLIKEMTIAARLGRGDIDSNPRLRTAVTAAKAANMPSDNIKRAIMKGTGELPGQAYEDVAYEGYGPGGVAMIITAVTDNKNRTVAEVRHVLSRYGGNLGETNSVAWMFQKKGYLSLDKLQGSEDELLEITLEAGADDLKSEGNTYEIICATEKFEEVKRALEDHGKKVTSAEITMLPQTYVHLEGKKAEQMIKLMEALEEHDDVQNVYANFDIDEAILEAAS